MKLKWRWFPLAAMLALALGVDAAPARLELWLYASFNLWVDKNLDDMEGLFQRAAKAGYTHVLVTDSKFSKLGDMDARYFRNVDRVKSMGRRFGLEIVPALFSIGYSNDLLWHDPNLIEAMPVSNALFVVKGGEARAQSDPLISLKGGDFADLKRWDWKDDNVVSDEGAALIKDPQGRNARIVQKLKLTPFRQYHLTVSVKTSGFQGTPEVKVLAGNMALNHNHLGAKPNQDWTIHHVVFNSLTNTLANLYLGCWGGGQGSLWFKDARIEEAGLVNLVRRAGAPLEARIEGGRVLAEGVDYEQATDPLMGSKPWPGEYTVWHEAPALKTRLPEGTRLRVSYYHGVTVYDGQAMICLSEPRTLDLLRDQAQRMHKAWGAKGYFMSHDEIRVLNWCAACQKRNLDAGGMLADHVRQCTKLLREINPGGKVYVWSDMFDPHHNAHKDYYLVRGDLGGSWEGLDKEVVLAAWHFDKRAESLKFFAGRGNRLLIAGYYDDQPGTVKDWLEAAKPYPGVLAVMYTTWQHKYSDMEKFAGAVHEWEHQAGR